jgi:hypothetical protein
MATDSGQGVDPSKEDGDLFSHTTALNANPPARIAWNNLSSARRTAEAA